MPKPPIQVPPRKRRNAAPPATSPEKRRLIDPCTCDPAYTETDTEFGLAMDKYKRDNRRPFPTWKEVLEVVLALGYRKVAERRPLPGYETKLAALRKAGGHAGA